MKIVVTLEEFPEDSVCVGMDLKNGNRLHVVQKKHTTLEEILNASYRNEIKEAK